MTPEHAAVLDEADPYARLIGPVPALVRRLAAAVRDLDARAEAAEAERDRLNQVHRVLLSEVDRLRDDYQRAARLTKDWDAWAEKAMAEAQAVGAERDAERSLADRLAEALEDSREGFADRSLFVLAAHRAARAAPEGTPMASEAVWREAHGYDPVTSTEAAAAAVAFLTLLVGAGWAVWRLARRGR